MRLLITSSTDLECSEPVILAVEALGQGSLLTALKNELREFAEGLAPCENGNPCCEVIVNGQPEIEIFNKVDFLTKIDEIATGVIRVDGNVYLHKLNAPCGGVDYWDIFTVKKI